MKRAMVCEKGSGCLHLKIADLVVEIDKPILDLIKAEDEEFEQFLAKLQELGSLVKIFEKEMVEAFDQQGFYPCVDYQQIIFGRWVHRAKVVELDSNIRERREEWKRLHQ